MKKKKSLLNRLAKKLLCKENPVLLYSAELLVKSLRIESLFIPKSQAIIICIHEEMIPYIAYGIRLSSHQREQFIVLTSMHRDGNILDWILDRQRIKVVRGSSSKGGRVALNTIFNSIRDLSDGKIMFAADGPRGPRRKVKAGVVLLAKRKSLPIYIVRFHYKGWRATSSWDKNLVPWPFAKVRVNYSKAIIVKRQDDVKAIQNELEKTIAEMD